MLLESKNSVLENPSHYVLNIPFLPFYLLSPLELLFFSSIFKKFSYFPSLSNFLSLQVTAFLFCHTQCLNYLILNNILKFINIWLYFWKNMAGFIYVMSCFLTKKIWTFILYTIVHHFFIRYFEDLLQMPIISLVLASAG